MPKTPKKFYQLTQNDDVADLYIFGDICSWAWPEYGEQSGVTIVNQLKALNAKTINVHINSYGGDVAEGLAIYNTLREHAAEIVTICDGFACSAASVVFMAGDRRVMSPASLLMIHNAWTIAMGNAAELRKTADDIETITQASVNAYKQHAKISEAEIKELMDAETWILPEQAVEYGFATEIDEEDPAETVQQSAFSLIVQRLTATEAVLEERDITIDEEALDRLADRIAVKLAAKKPKPAEEPKEEPKKSNPPVVNRGWDLFFAKGAKK